MQLKSEPSTLFPFVRRSRFADSQRRLRAFEDALDFERSLSSAMASALRDIAHNSPQGRTPEWFVNRARRALDGR